MAKYVNSIWKFITKQICFVDKEAYEKAKLIRSLSTFDRNHDVETRLDHLHSFIKSEKNNNLYCIVPYFNFVKSVNRKKLFLEFIDRYKNIDNLKIIVVEAISKEDFFDLPSNIDGVYKYLSISISDILWIKENLINIAIKYLPFDWNYVIWIDADIQFINTNWIQETIDRLEESHIVQLFQHAINLGPNGETFRIDEGFIYCYKESGQDYDSDSYYTYNCWHPGYAWGMNKDFYEKAKEYNVFPLIDYCIVGSNDHHMALAFIGKSKHSYPLDICDDYKERIIEYENFCISINLRLDYINGTIVHFWHGSLKNRRYNERWNMLLDNNFKPYNDISYNDKGLLQFTTKGKRFNKVLMKYFYDRKEDSNDDS